MTARVWSIKANGNAVTDVELVSVNVQMGQRYILEPLSASTMTITGRYPAGYATPNPDLVIDAEVELYENTTTFVYKGRVTDVVLELGIPYSGGVGPADFVTISVEGVLGVAGRTNVTTTTADDTVSKVYSGFPPPMLVTALADAGIDIGAAANAFPIAPTNRTWNGLELIQAWWNTYPFVVSEGPFGATAGYLTGAYAGRPTNTVNFSDTANNATNQVYDQITIDSLSDNYYTAAELTREASSAVGSYQVGSEPYVLYTGLTIAASDAANQSRAEVIPNVYGVASFDVVGVSCLSEAQNSWNLWLGNSSAAAVMGSLSNVTFRGNTTTVIIIGMTITATPETSRITYFFTPKRYFEWLTLDSATVGILDTNRLGYILYEA